MRLINVTLGPHGRVEGAVVTAPGGKPETATAGAVILATNGFGARRDLVRAHMPTISEALYFGGHGSIGRRARDRDPPRRGYRFPRCLPRAWRGRRSTCGNGHMGDRYARCDHRERAWRPVRRRDCRLFRIRRTSACPTRRTRLADSRRANRRRVSPLHRLPATRRDAGSSLGGRRVGARAGDRPGPHIHETLARVRDAIAGGRDPFGRSMWQAITPAYGAVRVTGRTIPHARAVCSSALARACCATEPRYRDCLRLVAQQQACPATARPGISQATDFYQPSDWVT